MRVLASLVEAPVDVFNWRLARGLRRDHEIVDEDEDEDGKGATAVFEPETVPAWVANVPRLEEPLRLGDVKRNVPLSAAAQVFSKRNIEAEAGGLLVHYLVALSMD
ncbi:MAG: hypothetical protein M1816_001885 [Peltula sp. TS41687]|nr:MAG: hypothetical protein M1816_001885 [Peltula sp. TS41687]